MKQKLIIAFLCFVCCGMSARPIYRGTLSNGKDLRFYLNGTNRFSAVRLTNSYINCVDGWFIATNSFGTTNSLNGISNTVWCNFTLTNSPTVPSNSFYEAIIDRGTGPDNGIGRPTFNVKIDRVTLYSAAYGLAIFGGPSVAINNLVVNAKYGALDHRGITGTITNSQFYAFGGLPTDGTCISLLVNDDSTNDYRNCTIAAGGGSVVSQGSIIWVRSKTRYFDCTLGVGAKTGSSGDAIINYAEDPSYTYYSNCTFNLAYTNAPKFSQLAVVSGSGLSSTFTIIFDHCNITPATNGIIFDNTVGDTTAITVIGGNLQHSNFANANTVTWQ